MRTENNNGNFLSNFLYNFRIRSNKLAAYTSALNKVSTSWMNAAIQGADFSSLRVIANRIMPSLGALYIVSYVASSFPGLALYYQLTLAVLIIFSIALVDKTISAAKDQPTLKIRAAYPFKAWMIFQGASIMGAMFGYLYYNVLVKVIQLALEYFSVTGAIFALFSSPVFNLLLLSSLVILSVVTQINLAFNYNNQVANLEDKRSYGFSIWDLSSMLVTLSFSLAQEFELIKSIMPYSLWIPIYLVLVTVHQFNLWYDVYRMQSIKNDSLDFLVLYGEKTQLLVCMLRQSVRSYMDFLLLGIIVEFAPIAFSVRIVAAASTFAYRYFFDASTIRASHLVLKVEGASVRDNAIFSALEDICHYTPIAFFEHQNECDEDQGDPNTRTHRIS